VVAAEVDHIRKAFVVAVEAYLWNKQNISIKIWSLESK
jgi:hypothetical protein